MVRLYKFCLQRELHFIFFFFFFFLAIFGRTFDVRLRRTLFNIFDTNGVSLVSQTYVLEHTLWNIFLILMACHRDVSYVI